MSNVIEMSPRRALSASQTATGRSPLRTAAEFRRLLSEMGLRPPSQRAFLRRLLQRAAIAGTPTAFPVNVPVVSP